MFVQEQQLHLPAGRSDEPRQGIQRRAFDISFSHTPYTTPLKEHRPSHRPAQEPPPTYLQSASDCLHRERQTVLLHACGVQSLNSDVKWKLMSGKLSCTICSQAR